MHTAHSPGAPRPRPAGWRSANCSSASWQHSRSWTVDSLVALLTNDVWVRMPPLPFEYRGAAAAHRFFSAVDAHRRAIAKMVPVRANGQPAWGEYIRDPITGRLHVAGVLVVALAGDRISEITHFETTVAPYFSLPRTLDV